MEANKKDSFDPKAIKPFKPIRALVLPGGGGRGAYQVGVVKALLESGLTFDYAFGTSIGGINAALLAQDSLPRLEQLWGMITGRDVFCLPSAHQIGRLVLGHKLGLLDNHPLELLLRREIDLQRIKSSSMKVGWCTTDLCSLETKLITIDEVSTTSELIDVLMATSAIPMAFPPRHILGKGLWVDGGLVRNTPMETAIHLGADEIYMVLLHPEKISVCPVNMFEVLVRCLDIVLDASARKEIQNAELYNRLLAAGSEESRGRKNVTIRVFQPKTPVNTTLLEIHPERSRKLIRQGYEEAMDQLDGYQKEEDRVIQFS
ncbi:MAG: patatin-like phospholipase family protein [Cyanobacteriota/Melainabacteria group bacterium]|nr:patatin-like phospholipase family protein [Cyanobacteria bacterium HKST-UBA01]MCB9467649.1 patatin-like phospholipase family protein [Candidatus Obscuribacterales bacterium]